MQLLSELLSLLETRPGDDNTPAWYIVRVKDDAISSGPYDSRRQANSDTSRLRWWNATDYDICYGKIDDEKSDKFDVFMDMPEPKSEGLVTEGAMKALQQKLEDAIIGNWLSLSTAQIVKRVKGWPEFKGISEDELENLVDDAREQAHNQVDEGLIMVEGAYVVKNKDGVEKRFKDADAPAAVAWKNSGKQAVAKKTPAPKVDKKAQLDHEVWTVEHCMTTADGWGELDSHDVMMRKVFPAIVKAVRKDPAKFSEAFKDALDKAVSRDYGIWDKINPWLDKAAKAEGYKNFNAFCDGMNDQDLS